MTEGTLTRAQWRRLGEVSQRLHLRDQRHQEKSRKLMEEWKRRPENAADRRYDRWLMRTSRKRDTLGLHYASKLLRIPEAALLKGLRGTPFLLDFGVGASGERHAFIRYRYLKARLGAERALDRLEKRLAAKAVASGRSIAAPWSAPARRAA